MSTLNNGLLSMVLMVADIMFSLRSGCSIESEPRGGPRNSEVFSPRFGVQVRD